MDQLPLPWPAAPSYALADFIADASNAEALAWLGRPEAWPGGRLGVWGAKGAGKTHLLRGAATGWHWPVLAGAALHGWSYASAAPGLALDDADAAEPATLLHLLNIAAERGQRVLLAAREAPARWTVALPDLRSRLGAMTAVEVGAPTDALLAALLAKHLADRQLHVGAALQAWLLTRLPRSSAAIAEAVARLDAAALACGGPLTRTLASAALGGLLADQG